MNGVDTAVKTAADHSWEAVTLVVIVIVMITFFSLLGRWFIRSTEKRLAKAAEENEQRLREAREREQRMGQRIDHLEDYIKATLTTIIGDNSKTIADNSRLMVQYIASINSLVSALHIRPCLLDEKTILMIHQIRKEREAKEAGEAEEETNGQR